MVAESGQRITGGPVMGFASGNFRCPNCGCTFATHPSEAALTDENPRSLAPRATITPIVLHSWKEIASYLGLAVRTTQRWAHDFGLPVHRPTERERVAVFAFPQEIDKWLHSRPVQAKPAVPANGKPAGNGGAANQHCA